MTPDQAIQEWKRRGSDATRRTKPSAYKSLARHLRMDNPETALIWLLTRTRHDAVAAILGWREAMMQGEAAPKTISVYDAQIRSLFKYAYAVGAVEYSLTGLLPPLARAEAVRKTAGPTAAELKQILRNHPRRTLREKRVWHFVHFLSHTGFRIAEACRVKYHDIDWEKGQIKSKRKGHPVEKWWLVSRRALDVLRVWLAEKPTLGLVFPLSPRRFAEEFEWYGLQTADGERITPHMLRHTFATYLADQAAKKQFGLEHVAHLTGHKSVNSLLVYIDNKAAKARELLDSTDSDTNPTSLSLVKGGNAG